MIQTRPHRLQIAINFPAVSGVKMGEKEEGMSLKLNTMIAGTGVFVAWAMLAHDGHAAGALSETLQQEVAASQEERARDSSQIEETAGRIMEAQSQLEAQLLIQTRDLEEMARKLEQQMREAFMSEEWKERVDALKENSRRLEQRMRQKIADDAEFQQRLKELQNDAEKIGKIMQERFESDEWRLKLQHLHEQSDRISKQVREAMDSIDWEEFARRVRDTLERTVPSFELESEN